MNAQKSLPLVGQWAGRIVKYSNPEPGEESFCFLVIEDNGDRLHIEDYQNQAFLKPVETVAREDVELAS
jgi:hypothetical protein